MTKKRTKKTSTTATRKVNPEKGLSISEKETINPEKGPSISERETVNPGKGPSTSEKETVNPGKRPLTSKNGSNNVVKTIKKGGSGTSKNMNGNIYKRCQEYHRLKREVLAPFIAALLIKHRWDELSSGLDGEGTVFDSRVLNDDSGNASRIEMTLGRITEQDNSSEISYQEDWRNGSEQSDSSFE